ncbi:ladderlectin-like [Enoplosus armatus]|uniref:ladderlectin-like n=1 Tax=Enoplosus armatus TaxID=215367 RepID=UPI003996B1A6
MEAKTWDKAQTNCRENYTDLATIGSHDDMKRLVSMAADSGVKAEIWIGLKKTGLTSWMWSENNGSRGVYAVLQEKSWRQAQEYCRLNYTDLASVRSQTENQALQQIVHEKYPSASLVWIGLFRDEWKWSDQSDSSFRYWGVNQPNNDGRCALYHPASKKWR